MTHAFPYTQVAVCHPHPQRCDLQMGKGKAIKRRQANFERAHPQPASSLPPPPSGKDAQGHSYLPRSLKRLLEAKVL